MVYSAAGMTRANRDVLNARVAGVMRAGSEPLLALLFPPPAPAPASPRRSAPPAPLATRQRALLDALQRRTAPPHAPPRHVLCLRAAPHASPRSSPHPHRAAPRLNLDHLRHQIRTQG